MDQYVFRLEYGAERCRKFHLHLCGIKEIGYCHKNKPSSKPAYYKRSMRIFLISNIQ